MADHFADNADRPLGHHHPLGLSHFLGGRLQRQSLGGRSLAVLDLSAFFPQGFPDLNEFPVEESVSASSPSTSQAPETTLQRSVSPARKAEGGREGAIAETPAPKNSERASKKTIPPQIQPDSLASSAALEQSPQVPIPPQAQSFPIAPIFASPEQISPAPVSPQAQSFPIAPISASPEQVSLTQLPEQASQAAIPPQVQPDSLASSTASEQSPPVPIPPQTQPFPIAPISAASEQSPPVPIPPPVQSFPIAPISASLEQVSLTQLPEQASQAAIPPQVQPGSLASSTAPEQSTQIPISPQAQSFPITSIFASPEQVSPAQLPEQASPTAIPPQVQPSSPASPAAPEQSPQIPIPPQVQSFPIAPISASPEQVSLAQLPEEASPTAIPPQVQPDSLASSAAPEQSPQVPIPPQTRSFPIAPISAVSEQSTQAPIPPQTQSFPIAPISAAPEQVSLTQLSEQASPTAIPPQVQPDSLASSTAPEQSPQVPIPPQTQSFPIAPISAAPEQVSQVPIPPQTQSFPIAPISASPEQVSLTQLPEQASPTAIPPQIQSDSPASSIAPEQSTQVPISPQTQSSPIAPISAAPEQVSLTQLPEESSPTAIPPQVQPDSLASSAAPEQSLQVPIPPQTQSFPIAPISAASEQSTQVPISSQTQSFPIAPISAALEQISLTQLPEESSPTAIPPQVQPDSLASSTAPEQSPQVPIPPQTQSFPIAPISTSPEQVSLTQLPEESSPTAIPPQVQPDSLASSTAPEQSPQVPIPPQTQSFPIAPITAASEQSSQVPIPPQVQSFPLAPISASPEQVSLTQLPEEASPTAIPPQVQPDSLASSTAPEQSPQVPIPPQAQSFPIAPTSASPEQVSLTQLPEQVSQTAIPPQVQPNSPASSTAPEQSPQVPIPPQVQSFPIAPISAAPEQVSQVAVSPQAQPSPISSSISALSENTVPAHVNEGNVSHPIATTAHSAEQVSRKIDLNDEKERAIAASTTVDTPGEVTSRSEVTPHAEPSSSPPDQVARTAPPTTQSPSSASPNLASSVQSLPDYSIARSYLHNSKVFIDSALAKISRKFNINQAKPDSSPGELTESERGDRSETTTNKIDNAESVSNSSSQNAITSSSETPGQIQRTTDLSQSSLESPSPTTSAEAENAPHAIDSRHQSGMAKITPGLAQNPNTAQQEQPPSPLSPSPQSFDTAPNTTSAISEDALRFSSASLASAPEQVSRALDVNPSQSTPVLPSIPHAPSNLPPTTPYDAPNVIAEDTVPQFLAQPVADPSTPALPQPISDTPTDVSSTPDPIKLTHPPTEYLSKVSDVNSSVSNPVDPTVLSFAQTDPSRNNSNQDLSAEVDVRAPMNEGMTAINLESISSISEDSSGASELNQTVPNLSSPSVPLASSSDTIPQTEGNESFAIAESISIAPEQVLRQTDSPVDLPNASPLSTTTDVFEDTHQRANDHIASTTVTTISSTAEQIQQKPDLNTSTSSSTTPSPAIPSDNAVSLTTESNSSSVEESISFISEQISRSSDPGSELVSPVVNYSDNSSFPTDRSSTPITEDSKSASEAIANQPAPDTLFSSQEMGRLTADETPLVPGSIAPAKPIAPPSEEISQVSNSPSVPLENLDANISPETTLYLANETSMFSTTESTSPTIEQISRKIDADQPLPKSFNSPTSSISLTNNSTPITESSLHIESILPLSKPISQPSNAQRPLSDLPFPPIYPSSGENIPASETAVPILPEPDPAPSELISQFSDSVQRSSNAISSGSESVLGKGDASSLDSASSSIEQPAVSDRPTAQPNSSNSSSPVEEATPSPFTTAAGITSSTQPISLATSPSDVAQLSPNSDTFELRAPVEQTSPISSYVAETQNISRSPASISPANPDAVNTGITPESLIPTVAYPSESPAISPSSNSLNQTQTPELQQQDQDTVFETEAVNGTDSHIEFLESPSENLMRSPILPSSVVSFKEAQPTQVPDSAVSKSTINPSSTAPASSLSGALQSISVLQSITSEPLFRKRVSETSSDAIASTLTHTPSSSEVSEVSSFTAADTSLPTQWNSLADLLTPEVIAPASNPLGVVLTEPSPAVKIHSMQPSNGSIQSKASASHLSTAPYPRSRLSVPKKQQLSVGSNLHLQAQFMPSHTPQQSPNQLIQANQDTPFTTITAEPDASTSLQSFEQLAQEIYCLLRQRLAVEQERHGRLYPKRFR